VSGINRESSSGQAKKSSRAQSRGQARLRPMQGMRRWMMVSRAAAFSCAAARSIEESVFMSGSGRSGERKRARKASKYSPLGGGYSGSGGAGTSRPAFANSEAKRLRRRASRTWPMARSVSGLKKICR